MSKEGEKVVVAAEVKVDAKEEKAKVEKAKVEEEEENKEELEVVDEVTDTYEGDEEEPELEEEGYGDEELEDLGDEELDEEDDLHDDELHEEDLPEEDSKEDLDKSKTSEGGEEGGEKKEGEAEKAKEETKAKVEPRENRRNDHPRERMFLPNYRSYKIDLRMAMKVRSVVGGPFDLEDLQKEDMQVLIKQAEELALRFTKEGEEEKCTGQVQLRFKSFEEAKESVEKMEKFKEGLTVKQLVSSEAGRAGKLICGADDDVEIPADSVQNVVTVCGLPTTATVEQIKELFPDASIKLMALSANGSFRGYCYIEGADEEACKKLLEDQKTKPPTLDGKKLYLEKLQVPIEAFMVVDSDDVLTDDERSKVVRALNGSQLALDRRGARMKRNEYQDLVKRIRTLKQKLANDNRKRREKGMPLPKTTIRRPPIERSPYQGNRGRYNTQWIPRQEGRRGGRGDMTNRSPMRSPAPRRPIHRDERYGTSPGGREYYGSSPRRGDMGPPRRDSERGGRYGTEGRGSSRYANERGRSGKLNTHQTANAVNMLVGLTSLLSEMQKKTPGTAATAERRDVGGRSGGRESWGGGQASSYTERSRSRSGGEYSTPSYSSSNYRESGYRDDWAASSRDTSRSSSATHYDDSYYDDRTSRKRTMSDRSGYNDDYYGRNERGGIKRSRGSRGRGGGGHRGRY